MLAPSRIALLIVCWAGSSGSNPAGAQADVHPLAAERRSFDLIDNGDFGERFEGTDPERSALIPWWRVRGQARVVESDGVSWLELQPGSQASQPVPAYAPFARDLRLVGLVRGAGILEVKDGSGDSFSLAVGLTGEDTPFTLTGADLEQGLGHAIQPRLEVRLNATEGEPVAWTKLQAWITLPCPDEATLRADVVARLEHVFGSWLQLGRVEGSPFIHRAFDVVTGEPMLNGSGAPLELDGGMFPLFPLILNALAWEDNATWRTAIEAFMEAYLDRCLDESTHLPRRWQRLQQRPAGSHFREIGADLGFLIDAGLEGPEAYRKKCLRAAWLMGETVLARGVLPDGTVAASYRADDGAITLATNPLRRLDVPTQLARLGALTGDRRHQRTARNALAVFEFTHHWPGTWRTLDPGFDDDFGHYAARAVTMLEGFPEDSAMAAVVDDGWTFFRPLWRDSLRFGGTIAADEVRCWELLLRRAQQTPALADELRPLLAAALRAHFKSQQYRNGAFGDVTFSGFNPKTGIQVGDLPGAPANLLLGLALCYGEGVPVGAAQVRAMTATLLLTSDQHYRRDHGYLLGQRESVDFNPAGGGIRLGPALVTWLEKLDGSAR